MGELLKQFGKFSVVGGVSFVVDYAIFMVLTQVLGFIPELASAISYTLATVLNYLLSMRYVFHSRSDLSQGREFVAFFVLSLMGLGINVVLVWAGTALFGTSAFALSVIKIVASGVTAIWNFWSRRHWLDGDAH